MTGAQPSPPRESRYDITLAQIRDHQKSHTAVMIDARDMAQFARGHLRDAINLPAGLEAPYIGRVLQQVPSSQLIIIYCSNAMCEAGNSVYEYLRGQGYSNLRVYRPGWAVLGVANVERSRDP